jgi:thiamine biosynthesis protein ThiS
MNLIVNGTADAAADGSTVLALLAAKKIDPAVAVVEINKSIVKKEDLGTTALHDGDVVEILRFVGGG